METPITFWIAFNSGILALLAFDLLVLHRKIREISFREAAVGSALWVALSLSFCAFVWRWRGPDSGLQFLTGYLVEYSLSADNIFVFVLIMTFFRVPKRLQHRVLFWGVLGALVMRGAMIGVGLFLVERFHWVLYIFGAILVVSGVKMFFQREEEELAPQNNPIIRFCRRCLPVTEKYEGGRFAVRRDGRVFLTPLAIVLIMLETTDLVFAVDSIPAIFAITRDSFIVYTSNVCAILGLRSMYFMLAGAMHRFIFLKAGLSIILTFIGIKMVIADLYKIPVEVSLMVIAAVLATAVVTSVIVTRGRGARGARR
ncbi:MAG TPA: TerC family protein [Verrucomicrobiae bacterium]|nr:TerC family protein [Verrucomicrobiae bacterium]